MTEGVQSGKFKALAEKNINLFSCILLVGLRGVELYLLQFVQVDNRERGTNVLANSIVDGIKS